MNDINNLNELVKKVSEGDLQSFFHLYELKWANVLYSAYKILGNMQEAEFVTQETYLTAYMQINDLESPEKFEFWLYKILINQCKAVLANRTNEVIENIADESNSDDTNQIVMDAIDGLDVSQRMVIIMHYYQQLSCTEIGEILEISTEETEDILKGAESVVTSQIG